MVVDAQAGGNADLNEVTGWIGSAIADVYGSEVGRLEDVWIDPGTGLPRWLLVDRGGADRTTLIPFEYAAAGASGVWIPYEAGVVARAPAVQAKAPLTRQVEAALHAHYDATVRPGPVAAPAGNGLSERAGTAADSGGAGSARSEEASRSEPRSSERPATAAPGDSESGREGSLEPRGSGEAPRPERDVRLTIDADRHSSRVDIEIDGAIRLRGELRRLEVLPPEEPER
jgi:hypothetical protein